VENTVAVIYNDRLLVKYWGNISTYICTAYFGNVPISPKFPAMPAGPSVEVIMEVQSTAVFFHGTYRDA